MKTRFAHYFFGFAAIFVSASVTATPTNIVLPEYSGGSGTVGQFSLSLSSGSYITGGTINGTFGNSSVSSSAGVVVSLNSQKVATCGPYNPDTNTGSPCNFSPVSWSSSIALNAISNGTNVVTADQTSPYVVRLGPTKLNINIMDTNPTKNTINTVLDIVRNSPANQGKTEREIAEAAFSALEDARHGFYGVNNEFIQLKNLDITTLANTDHFFQVYASGLGNNLIDNPLSAAVVGLIIDPVYNVGKAISQNVLGEKFFTADDGPQSPANFDFWGLSGAVAAIQVRSGSLPPDQAIKPVVTGQGSSVFVENASSTPILFDPIAAPGFSYASWAGPLFESVLVPQFSVPGLSEFILDVNGNSYTLHPDELFKFSTPVDFFSLRGFEGPFVGKSDFATQLTFAGTGTTVFEQRALAESIHVPEPSTISIFLLSLLTLVARVAKQKKSAHKKHVTLASKHGRGGWLGTVRLMYS